MDTPKPCTLSLNERLYIIGIKYWTLVILLCTIDILGPLGTDAHLPSLPIMTINLNTSPSFVQFTVLGYVFIMALSSLYGGILSDKYGRRNIILLGLLIFIIGGYGSCFSPNILILNIFRIIQGIGGGISSIITSSITRDVFLSNERIKINGILGSIRPIGIAISPIFGGWITNIFNWRIVFGSIATFSVIVLLFTLFKLPETKNKFFVNKNQIKLLNKDINDIGNIDIVDESNYNINPMDIDHTYHDTPGIIVVDDDDDEDDDEWTDNSGIIQPVSMHSMHSVYNTSSASIITLKTTTKSEINNNNDSDWYLIPINYWKTWKIACSDRILMTVSWIIAFRSVGLFIFFNEFPYVVSNKYKYNSQISGLLIGTGACFLIFGVIISITNSINSSKINVIGNTNTNNNNNLTELSELLFQLKPKNKKLTIMKFSSICALISCLLLIIPPLFFHYKLFLNILDIDNDNHISDLTHNLTDLNMFNLIYTDNPWYFIVIPYCLLCFSQGLFISPAYVVVLEPYPHCAARITSILQFWRILLPSITLIIITQSLSYNTYNCSSIVIHLTIGLSSFLCFILMFGCISSHDVRLRMSGWQNTIIPRMNTNNTYGSVPIGVVGVGNTRSKGINDGVTVVNSGPNSHIKSSNSNIVINPNTVDTSIEQYIDNNIHINSSYDSSIPTIHNTHSGYDHYQWPKTMTTMQC